MSKIQSLDPPTTATRNHESNHKTAKRLGQHVNTTLMFMFTDINQAYFRNYVR